MFDAGIDGKLETNSVSNCGFIVRKSMDRLSWEQVYTAEIIGKEM